VICSAGSWNLALFRIDFRAFLNSSDVDVLLCLTDESVVQQPQNLSPLSHGRISTLLGARLPRRGRATKYRPPRSTCHTNCLTSPSS
jgi:hypothetical protein